MKKLILLVAIMFSIVVFGQEFKVYPNAKLDEELTKEANEAAKEVKMNIETLIYTTNDSFQDVCDFYIKIGVEYTMPKASGTKGKPKKYEDYDLYEAFFILDGAKDLSSSKLWIKVQRPYIGEEIKDITTILVSKKK